MLADAHELMHARLAAHDCPVVDADVARERDVVGDDRVAADAAVVCHVDVGHEEVVAADRRDALVLNRADRERAVFADHVVVAHDEHRVLARILLVLRIAADRSARVDHVAAADRRAALDADVAAQVSARTDPNLRPDEAEGADDDVGGEHGIGMNDGGRMNLSHDNSFFDLVRAPSSEISRHPAARRASDVLVKRSTGARARRLPQGRKPSNPNIID